MISCDHDVKGQKRKILIFENSFALTNDLTRQWVEWAQDAVRRRNRFTVALSGGHSPMEFYCRLSSLKDFDLWKHVHIFIGDERYVPLDDGASNFKMIKENLLDYIHIPSANIHPVLTHHRNVDQCADHYKDELFKFFELNAEGMPCFDFMLLGIGTDGHTASLFPDDDRISDPGRVVLPVSLPHLKHERVSLTLSVINSARTVVTMGLGTPKARIVKEIIEGASGVPAARVHPSNGTHFYFLDKDAAQQLSYHDRFSHEGQAISYDPRMKAREH